MKKAFMAGLLAGVASFRGLENYSYAKGNPTRWRSVKQDLQTQSQKRHRADKRIK